MRITIDTDDKSNVNIETEDKGNNKPGLFEQTTDIPLTDGGAAPIEHLQLLNNVTIAAEGDNSVTSLARDPKAELPLNPLRAGAAAAYQSTAQRTRDTSDQETIAVAYQETSSTQDLSIGATDGGRAAYIPAANASSEAPATTQPAKSRKKR